MNIAAYCRVSTDKHDQINSLEAQKVFFDEFAKSNGHNLVCIYADEGISGTKIKNRTEFQRLMKDAKTGLFDMVIVKDISRFARNTVDFLNSIRALKTMNIETVFLTSNQTVMGNSEFILTIYGALAQEESANTSKRVKFGKKLNASKGRVPNIVYGYDKIKGEYFNLRINDFEANIVRKIFDLYVNEGYGTNKIAQILNHEGVQTKRGFKWSQNAVARILSNELYCGTIINGKEEIADFLTGQRKEKDEAEWMITERQDLQIIEQDIFKQAGKILTERGGSLNTYKERQSNKHLFSTLIKCKHCGYSFRRIERVYQNQYIKWVCSGRNTRGAESCPCTAKLDENELKTAIHEFFISTLSSKKDVIGSILKEFNRIYSGKNDNKNLEKELSDKFAKAIKSRKKYMDMYEDDLITRDELREKASALNKEIEQLENELKIFSCATDKEEELEDILSSTFTNIENIMDIELMTNARLKRVIDKITVDENGNMDIYLKLLSDMEIGKNVLISYNYT
ncbi:MAG: recombinase family protein [Defluviitaleaceae bacterium]|nr:recombinase family protein [Defluviitaleaceae bacterium]